jgi:hypothetical protein
MLTDLRRIWLGYAKGVDRIRTLRGALNYNFKKRDIWDNPKQDYIRK